MDTYLEVNIVGGVHKTGNVGNALLVLEGNVQAPGVRNSEGYLTIRYIWVPSNLNPRCTLY